MKKLEKISPEPEHENTGYQGNIEETDNIVGSYTEPDSKIRIFNRVIGTNYIHPVAPIAIVGILNKAISKEEFNYLNNVFKEFCLLLDYTDNIPNLFGDDPEPTTTPTTLPDADTTTKSSKSGFNPIPIAVGLGAAVAGGVGVKAYKNHKQNSEFDDTKPSSISKPAPRLNLRLRKSV